MNIKAIVTDIEGTTSSIEFVHDILIPYASKKLPDYVRKHAQQPDMVEILANTMVEADEAEASTERCIEILMQWIAEDKKATPLKALQGMIWEHGYALCDFTGHVYEDATRNLTAWHDAGKDLYIFSSGSVKAQKLLFSHSDAGDLTPLFKGYFDTRIGNKRETESYKAIIDKIGLPADEILFLSDIVEELDAARDAGMQTIQLVRDDTTPSNSHLVAHSFDDIQP